MSDLAAPVEYRGLRIYSERHVPSRSTVIGADMPKVRHIPGQRWSMWVSDEWTQDSLVDIGVAIRSHMDNAIARYERFCVEYPRKLERKARAARKRRRGWA